MKKILLISALVIAVLAIVYFSTRKMIAKQVIDSKETVIQVPSYHPKPVNNLAQGKVIEFNPLLEFTNGTQNLNSDRG